MLLAVSAAAEERFSIREGDNLNLLFRDGEAAAHAVVTARGRKPRIVVAFPAGNAGAGLWFEGSESPADWFQAPGGLSRDGKGVSFDVTASTGLLRLRRVMLDSVRALRDYSQGAHGGREDALAQAAEGLRGLPPDERERLEAGGLSLEGLEAWRALPGERRADGSWLWARKALGSGAPYELTLRPGKGTRLATGAAGGPPVLEGDGGKIRFRVSASAGYPPLAPLPAAALLNERGRRCAERGEPRLREAARNLAFLSYREKFLAGSWQYLTYFGRDTLVSVRALAPVLTVDAVEAGLRSVLDRLSPEGEVAHEEDLGDQAVYRRLQEAFATRGSTKPLSLPLDAPIHDYKMIDGEFLLPLLAAEYAERAGRERFASFLKAASPAGPSYGERLALAAGRVLALTAPYADARRAGKRGPELARHLIRLKPGVSVGDWRDSEEGLGLGRYPSSVNVGIAAAAARAYAKVLTAGVEAGDGALGAALRRAGGGAALESVASAWDRAGEHFLVSLGAGAMRTRLRRYLERGLAPEERAYFEAADLGGATLREFVTGRKTPEGLERGLSFWALSLDSEGRPIAVQSSDAGFALEGGALSPEDAERAAMLLALPFPVGLASPVGLLVANPAFSEREEDYARFGKDRYHGAVAWSWPISVARRGLAARLAAAPKGSSLELRLRRALDAARAGEKAVAGLRASELWSWEVRDAKLLPVPFGAGATDATEANAVQLWSTLNLASDCE